MVFCFQANSLTSSIKSLTYEDRALNLEDTQGMFLLLGAGFLIGITVLLFEIFGGCFDICKRKRRDSNSSIESNPRFHERQTPRDWQQVQYLRRFSNHTSAEVHQSSNAENVSSNSSFRRRGSTRATSKEIEEQDMDKEVDRIFENVFGEKFVHDEKDQDRIMTNWISLEKIF